MLDFRLLGPLEVLGEDGSPLPLGGAKQRAVLAVLLLRAGEVVSSEFLIDAVWGEEPPRTAATSLQNSISALRKLLGSERLLTRPPGYLLAVEREWIDLARFERSVAEARSLEPDERADALRCALELWRGPPLADLAFESFASPEVFRLEERRLAALEDLLEAEVARGRAAEVVPELESLVVQHPLRERLRGQLMLALYHSGRQAEALAAYQDARRAVVEELGLEPGPQLQELDLLGGGAGEVLRARWSPDGTLAVSADADGTARIWAVRTKRLLQTLRPGGGAVNDAEFSPDGKLVVTAGAAGSARIWDVAGGTLVRTLAHGSAVSVASFDPAGRTVVSAGADGVARVWDARTGRLLASLRGHGPLADVEFSSDGKTLATSSTDTDGRLWDVASGRSLHVLRGHFGPVAAIALSPDGRWAATAGPISAGLWPAATGRILFYLRGDTSLLTSISFAPDGQRILSSSRDGTVRVYTCAVCGNLQALVALADQRLERTAHALTPALVRRSRPDRRPGQDARVRDEGAAVAADRPLPHLRAR